MGFILIIIIAIIVWVIYSQTTNGKPASPVEESAITQKIQESECSKLFVSHYVTAFNPGGEPYQWLLTNSKERHYQFQVNKIGVFLTQIEVNRSNKENGYKVDSEGIGFGASGYADLPDSYHVQVFKAHLIDRMKALCPNIEFFDNDTRIRLKESAKKAW